MNSNLDNNIPKRRFDLKSYFTKIGPVNFIIRLVLLYLIVAFVIIPNLNVLKTVFIVDGQFSFDAFESVFGSARALTSLKNSFILAISLIVSVNVVGILIVLLTEYFDIKGSKFLKPAYLTTLIYGGVTLVTGYKIIYGKTGILTNMLVSLFPSMDNEWFTGYVAVVFVMTFAVTGNHMLFLSNAINSIDYHTIEAAKNMGAKGWTIFKRIVLPTIKPTIFAVTILTFITGLGAVSAPLIVGGKEFETISPLIIQFAKSDYTKDVAAALSIILGILTIILLFIFTKVEKNGNYLSVSKTKNKMVKQKIENKFVNVFMHIIAYVLFVIYVIPLVIVVLFSFTEPLAVTQGIISFDTFTLSNYASLFTNASSFSPYLTSFLYAILASVIVTFICLLTARIVHKSKDKFSKIFEYGVLIPWLLPATLVGIGLIVTYGKPNLLVLNNVLVGTTVLLLIGYIVVKLPFTFRMIKASLYGFDPNLEDAAKSMGSSEFRTLFVVVIPVLLPTLLSVIVLNFNSLLTDYDLTVLLYHTLHETLGIVIKNASDETATMDAKAMVFVYSVVLMIISSLALWFANYGGYQKIKKLIKR